MTPSEPLTVEQRASQAAMAANEIADALTDEGAHSWIDCSNAARLGYLRGHSDAWPTVYADGHEDGYKRGRAEMRAELSKRARHNARLAFAALTVALFAWAYLNENAREVLAWLVTW